MSTTQVARSHFESHDELTRWLHVGDPLAEAVFSELRSVPHGLADPLPAMRRLAAEGNEPCARLLASMRFIPEWVDFEAMRVGAAMAARHFPQFALSHSHGALLTTFGAPASAGILARTGRFEQGMARRFAESATLFFRVLEIDALQPDGEVWEICLRIRLLHTMVRMKLLRSGEWNLADGVPINALHTSAGPLFFGTFVLRGLRSLGTHVSPAEADGYRMIWRYATRLLGVPDELLGRTEAEQKLLDDTIEPTVFDPDDNSRRLTRALFRSFRTIPKLSSLPDEIHAALIARVLGGDNARRLGIVVRPRARMLVASGAFALWFFDFGQRVRFLATRSERWGFRLMRKTVDEGLAGLAADYQMK
jgi:hypothetical protein